MKSGECELNENERERRGGEFVDARRERGDGEE